MGLPIIWQSHFSFSREAGNRDMLQYAHAIKIYGLEGCLVALHGVLHLLTEDCTTGQLEEHINRESWGLRKVSIYEKDGRIFWMGKEVPVRRFPVYLANDDPRRKAPAQWSEECDDFGQEPGAKQVWVPHYCLYRSPQTEGKWHSPCPYEYVTLCADADWAELLYLDEEEAYLERFELTEDPQEENPASQEFEYYGHLGVLTITGVRHYCERLHIPAQLDGMPVAKVCLSNSLKLRYLRELVVEEGVQKLDFFFGFSELETIRIPPSVLLVRSPDYISYSRWFENQPDGPVYFQNYYCGTKGVPQQDTLTLRDGTVGVIRWADERQKWRQISLPATLTYIANGGFYVGRHLQKVEFPKGTEQLKAYFTWLYHFYGNRRKEKPETIALSDGKPLTGKALYDIGRCYISDKHRIPRQWIPTAPRLRYQNGWIAEYWYCAGEHTKIGFYAAVSLPAGESLEVKMLTGNSFVSGEGYWTDTYLPPEYLMAEDYLDCCAVILRSGEPTKEILEQLEDWWKRLMPRNVLEALKESEE